MVAVQIDARRKELDILDVSSTTGVVTWKQRVKRHNAVAVTLLDASEEGRVKVRVVLVRVTVATSADARVDTSRVAVPDLDVHALHGLAGLNIEDLEFDRQGDTLLTVRNVFADKLALHICVTVSDDLSLYVKVGYSQ